MECHCQLCTSLLLLLCGADLPVVSEDVTAETQAIRFSHSFLSFLSLLNCSFLCLLCDALKEVRKFIMVIFNGFLKSSTTPIELIQENFLELQCFLLLLFFFFCISYCSFSVRKCIYFFLLVL